MKKERHNPDKPQNNYGGNYNCKNYDNYYNGKEFCHDEGQSNWNEDIKWIKYDTDGNLLCKGNRHNCYKQKLKWFASLSQEQKIKYSLKIKKL